MIEARTQYRILCDAPDCKASTGLHHDQAALTRLAENNGWECVHSTLSESVVLLWRCKRCVERRKVPVGWPVSEKGLVGKPKGG